MSVDAIRIQRSWARCVAVAAPSVGMAALMFATGGRWMGLPFAVLAGLSFAGARRSGIELTQREVLVHRRASTHRLQVEEIASLTREPWRHWDPMEILTFRTHRGRVVRADYPWSIRRMESPAMDRAYHDVAQWLLARQPDAQARTAE